MRSILVGLLGALSFISCQKEQLISESKSWHKIEVPDVSTIYALEGSLADYLLVAGLHGVVKTVNEGKTWNTVLPGVIVGEFRHQGDTLLGVTNNSEDYYSIDGGDSWKVYHTDTNVQRNNSVITSNENLMYKYVASQTYPKRPDLVFQTKNGGLDWEDMVLPDAYIYSIHIDKQNRLYIGAVGWVWNEVLGTFEDDDQASGFLYYFE